MEAEVEFLDTYKHDIAGADARLHQLFEHNLALTNHVAELEAKVFDAAQVCNLYQFHRIVCSLDPFLHNSK